MSIALWAIAWFVFRAKVVPLAEMDLSEIYLIEQEEEQAKLVEADAPTLSWWRKWLI